MRREDLQAGSVWVGKEDPTRAGTLSMGDDTIVKESRTTRPKTLFGLPDFHEVRHFEGQMMQTGLAGVKNALSLLPERQNQVAITSEEDKRLAWLLGGAQGLEPQDVLIKGARGAKIANIEANVPSLE